MPTQHEAIRVTESEREIEATFEDRRWILPRDDCVLLPVANTTAELIARWIAGELRPSVEVQNGASISTIQVEVEENFGQWAICEVKLTQS